MPEEFGQRTTDEPVAQIARKARPHFSVHNIPVDESWEVESGIVMFVSASVPQITDGTLIINGSVIELD